MKLEFCFVSRLNPGALVKSHSHNALELVYYTEGRGRISFDRRSWDFSEHDFHIAPAGISHKQKNTEDLCAICVGVSGSGLEDLSGTWHDHSGTLRYPLEQLVKELNAKEESCELITNGLLEQIVGLTRRIMASQSKGAAAHKSEKIDKALHIIRENEGRISLDNISDTLYISKDYLRHLVSKSTGQSPLRHIISSRMEKAKRLLETTDRSIGDVAVECGFNDIYYFSRFFKRNAKLPPAAYRKRSQGEK
ncbi:MAG: AraC family transcriptional regulator [Victivallales bacterium]